jgi:hypothetical protein
MDRQKELLIVISRLVGKEQRFFHMWGITPPDASPFCGYVGNDGRQSEASSAEIVLVAGHQPSLARRVEMALGATAGEPYGNLLVHVGGGQELLSILGTRVSKNEFDAMLGAFATHSFALTSGKPLTTLVHDIAHYARNFMPETFRNALTFLRARLREAAVVHTGGWAEAEARSAVAGKAVSEKRESAGLAGKAPPHRNPVAAIAHDVVGRFDALLMDVQHAVDNPASWSECRQLHEATLQSNLTTLCRAVNVDAGEADVGSLAHIMRTIAGCGRVSGDDIRVTQEAFAHLQSLVPEHVENFSVLLKSIVDGQKSDLTADDALELRTWVRSLRKQLAAIDRVYRQCLMS